MTKGLHGTPMLDEPESGPWSGFVSGIERLRNRHEGPCIRGMADDLLGRLEHPFDEIDDDSFDVGGASPCMRTGMSYAGAARCKISDGNEHRTHRTLPTRFTGDVRRPAPPYESKSKVFGYPSERMNSIERLDFASIGAWRNTRNRPECVGPYSFLIQIKDGGGARANNPLD